MKKTLALLVFMITLSCHGQTSQTTYFRDFELTREVSERRANYSKTVTKNSEGVVITEVKDLERGEVIIRNGEPFGIWTVDNFGEEKLIDYNFEMVYSKKECQKTITELEDYKYFDDYDQLGYKAPKISKNGISITQYIRNNIHYPVLARMSGASGTVYLTFTITKSGNIENLSVYEGVDVNLDKEAMRVMRELTIYEPPKINDQPIELCIKFPVRFALY